MTGSPIAFEDLELLQSRLGEAMSMSGYPLDESECRRLTAMAAGYLTWEDAVRSAQRRTKTYIVHCSFAFDDESRGRTTGWFDFLTSAPEGIDLRDLIAKCRAEVGRICRRSGAAGYFPSNGSFSMDDIVELDVIPARGTILNYRSVDSAQRVTVAMVPTDDLVPEIQLHSLRGPFGFDPAAGVRPSKLSTGGAPDAKLPAEPEVRRSSAELLPERVPDQTGIAKGEPGRASKKRPA